MEKTLFLLGALDPTLLKIWLFGFENTECFDPTWDLAPVEAGASLNLWTLALLSWLFVSASGIYGPTYDPILLLTDDLLDLASSPLW